MIALAIAVAAWLDAPRQLIISMTFTVIGVVVVGLVNLMWKLSAHAAMTAFLAVAASFALWPRGLFGWPVWIAVCWSRVRLRDHTLAQVISGGVVGAVIGLAYALFLTWS